MKPGEEDLSEDVAIKLALGYRKLIKISKDGEQDELIALLESFENKLVTYRSSCCESIIVTSDNLAQN